MESEDRLSNLPDCLIHHIFSFIDSLYLVRASVLARRWRHLYASTPVLSLSFENASEHNAWTPPPLNLVQWVRGLLAGRPTPAPTRFSALRIFSYAYNEIFVPGTIEAFVSAAAQRGALERLELTTNLSTFQLPTCLYTTRSLKANSLGASPVTKSQLMRQTSLQLDEVEVEDLQLAAYDIDLIKVVLESYVEVWRWRRLQVEVSEEEMHSLGKVAGLIDSYVRVVARDSNVSVAKLVCLVEMLPDAACPRHDDLYKAINTYLKVRKKEDITTFVLSTTRSREDQGIK